MAEQPLVGRDPQLRPFDLAPRGLAPQLPDQLANLGDRLRRDRLPETGQPAARVDRDASPDGGVAVAEEALGLTLLAQADVLVPVELERRRQVVDLGQVDVFGSDTRLFVGGRGDRLLKVGPTETVVEAESVEKLGISMIVWGKRGVTVDTASMVTRSAAPA